jgi:hypothetical protein
MPGESLHWLGLVVMAAAALGVVPLLRVSSRSAWSCSRGSQGENHVHCWTSGGGAIGVTSFSEASCSETRRSLWQCCWWLLGGVACAQRPWRLCHVRVGGEVQRNLWCWMSRVDVQVAVVISVSAGGGGALQTVSDT